MSTDLQRAAAHESFASAIRTRSVPTAKHGPLPIELHLSGPMPEKSREAWALGHEVHAARLKARAGISAHAHVAPPTASAPTRSMGREFSAMKPLERARLKQENPQRYEQLRAAYFSEAEQLEGRLHAARSLAERGAVLAQISELGQL